MKIRRTVIAVLVLAGGALAGYAFLPAPLSVSDQICSETPLQRDRCLIEGGPLQMSGTPVFLESKQQAFFPTGNDLRFVDAQGREWRAPKGTLTDGATIPPVFMPLVGDRQSREFILAAALHDAYCGIGNDTLETWQTRNWEAVHRMFYDALVVSGTTEAKARIMFAAVYLGGPRWNDPDRDLGAVAPEALKQELEWCLRWMERKQPSLLEIQKWMKDREADLLSGNQVEPDWAALFSDQA